MIHTLLEQLRAWSPPEAAAVLFAILYLVLAIRQKIGCWLFAGLSTALYVWLFAQAKLYMESLLNVFYLVMAIYGWIVWKNGKGEVGDLPVTVWPLRVHLVALGSIATLVFFVGNWLSAHTDAAFPFVDSATTLSAIWATFLVARKVLENWWYWLAIDAVSVLLYWSRGLELTSLLFVGYLVMIPFGLLAWSRSYRDDQARVAA